MTEVSLAIASEALKRGDSVEAVRLYLKFFLEHPELRDLLAFNLSLAKQKHRARRGGTPPRVGVGGWELSHNAAGRVQALADIHSRSGPVEIFGALLPQWRGRIWEPIRNGRFPVHAITVTDEAAFPRQALDLVLDHPFDVVHLSKPRLPGILFGLLYKLVWDARVLVDIDDEELGSVKAAAPLQLGQLPRTPGGQPRLRGLGGKLWTQIGVGQAGAFDGITVSNAALQARYGGTIIPHARDAGLFAQAAGKRAASRARLGLPADGMVVMFFGTVRRHKGVLETARALGQIGRRDVCLAVIGDCPDRTLKKQIGSVPGLNVIFGGVQPYDTLAEVATAGDICVLPLVEDDELARFQIPAKLTDALAAGMLVLAQRTAALASVLDAGAAVEITPDTLAATLQRMLDAPERAAAVRDRGRAYFEAELTVEQSAARLGPIARNPIPVPALCADVLPDERHAALFEAFGSWEMLRNQTQLPHGGPLPADPQGRRIVAYSVLVGEYDKLKEPESPDPAVRYILFTDRPGLCSDVWEIVRFDTLGLDPRRASRLPKLLPHRYLPEHEISVYLDASLTLQAPEISSLAGDLLGERDIAAYSHFKRDCTYDEIEECVAVGKADPAQAEALRRKLETEGFPRQYGLFENAFLVRRNTETIRRLDEAWYRLFSEGAERDQFYLMYLLWKQQVPVSRIADSGNFRKSAHLRFEKHPAALQPQDGAPTDTAPPAADPQARVPAAPPRGPNVDSFGGPSGGRGTPLTVVEGGAPPRGPVPQGRRRRINWVMNADNAGWAYGNNARALSDYMPDFDHEMDAEGDLADLAMYFDIKLSLMHGIRGRCNVLRVGGPRPVFLAYNYDFEKLRSDIAVFDAIIVLNTSLYRLFSALHPRVVLIPNAIDIETWRFDTPLLQRRADKPFTVGFSGNLKTTKERRIKGFDIAQAACEELKLPLLHFGKGEGQIPRDQMQARFYGEIDCLLHPVLPGKEGCSNVIMEALSLGVPVITTPDCGYHGERIGEGDGILYCRRDQSDIAEKLTRLREDPDLRARMSEKGRAFAERHHDIRQTAPVYHQVFSEAMAEHADLTVDFVPFWEPAADFASSRLRCAQPAALLQQVTGLRSRVGLSDGSDVAIISQLASDETYAAICARPDLKVIYDVCDRYFDDDREVGGVSARRRFYEMAGRADLIVGSTIELKRQISQLGIGTPVVYIPDGIDYREYRDVTPSDPAGPVLWYGNPGRKNFDSARWMIDHVMQKTRYSMRLNSRKRTFRHMAKTMDPVFEQYFDICDDWTYGTFVEKLRAASVCLVSHSPEESTKSPNRLITAIANGVPVIATTAPSCEALLRTGGMDYAVVSTPAELDAALERLSDPAERKRYLQRMQALIEERFGDVAIQNRYEDLLRRYLAPGRKGGRPARVLFLSHNLSVGEGAPTSLMQTVTGLAESYFIKPSVFAAAPGDLRKSYTDRGIEVFTADYGVKSRIATKVMARTREQMTEDLRRMIRRNEIDVVVANTATTLWMLDVADDMGVPGIAVIRESSDEHVGFNFGPEDLMDLCRVGLGKARATIFVSEHTRALWAGSHALRNAKVIPNGIDLSGFDPIRTLDKAAVRARLGLPEDKLILLSVGSINARKSQIDIVEALSRLPAETRARVHLALVGAKPSPYLTGFTERVAALGLADTISIVPENNEVALWYRSGDLFLFASRNESYPRVIVEAMSFGLPIVSSAIFGTMEQIVDGESGLLFAPGDVDALTEAMTRLIDSETLRAHFARQSEVRGWELISYREMLQQYYTEIQRLVVSDPMIESMRKAS